MLSRIFPRVIDNTFRGRALAIWILVPIVASKFFMGLNCAGLDPWVSNRWVIEHADGIALRGFPPEATQVIVFFFSAWGLALLVLSALAALALVRYRAMVPLIYVLLGAEQIGRKALSLVHPIAREATGGGVTAGAVINWSFSLLLVVGFVMAISGAGQTRDAVAEP